MSLSRDISLMFVALFSLINFLFLFRPRFSIKTTVIWSIAVILPLMGFNFFLLRYLGPAKMSTLLLLTCTLPSMIFFWILSKYRDGRFFFAFCFADTLTLELIHITSIADFYFGDTHQFMLISRLILCPLLALIVFRHIRPGFMAIQAQVRKGWYTFTAISLIFYVVLSLSVSYPVMITNRPEYLPAFILLLILMPMLYLNIFKTLRHQQQLHEISQQDNILKLQVMNMIARVEEFNAADEKFRIERHNFRHKMQTICHMIEEEQYEELKKLTAEYADTIQDTQIRRYCSYPVLDAVLATYLQRAESKGIRVSVCVALPDELGCSETELSTVFANAIENAIFACEKLPEQQRFIKVQVLTAPRFMIQISNSFNGDIGFDSNGIPIAHEKGHGFGTRSIVAFCEKNGALYEFKADNHIFALRLVFG